MKSCVVLRHVAFEDLGVLAPILSRRSLRVQYLDLGIDEVERNEVEDSDLLVVLGGPIGVYQEDAYPFLLRELALISERLASLRPTLGICLGAQLMAKALGARVAPGPAKEIGWAPVELTRAGLASPLRHIDGRHVLHWHGDNLDLPPACEALAFTSHCPVQAFQKGPKLLGLQFHIETDPRRIETWLVGHTVELAQAGIAPGTLRQDTQRHGAALDQAAAAIFNEWLDEAQV